MKYCSRDLCLVHLMWQIGFGEGVGRKWEFLHWKVCSMLRWNRKEMKKLRKRQMIYKCSTLRCFIAVLSIENESSPIYLYLITSSNQLHETKPFVKTFELTIFQFASWLDGFLSFTQTDAETLPVLKWKREMNVNCRKLSCSSREVSEYFHASFWILASHCSWKFN